VALGCVWRSSFQRTVRFAKLKRGTAVADQWPCGLGGAGRNPRIALDRRHTPCPAFQRLACWVKGRSSAGRFFFGMYQLSDCGIEYIGTKQYFVAVYWSRSSFRVHQPRLCGYQVVSTPGLRDAAVATIRRVLEVSWCSRECVRSLPLYTLRGG